MRSSATFSQITTLSIAVALESIRRVRRIRRRDPDPRRESTIGDDLREAERLSPAQWEEAVQSGGSAGMPTGDRRRCTQWDRLLSQMINEEGQCGAASLRCPDQKSMARNSALCIRDATGAVQSESVARMCGTI